MNKSTEVKKLLKSFNNVANDVMNIKYDTGKAPLIVFKNFINSNERIKEILKNIITDYESAEDFYTFNENSVEVMENINETNFLKSSYKLLCEDCLDSTELQYKAHKIYWTTKKYNDAINKYLKTSYFPLIRFIQTKLEEQILEYEDEEKIELKENNKIEIKQEGGKVNKVKISKSQNKETNFVFQKESFCLGILSAVISGLIVWGITELILKLV